MSKGISASRLPLLDKCIGPAVLPSVANISDDGAIGSAKHEHLQMRVTHGMDSAIMALDSIAERWGIDERDAAIAAAEMRKFTWTPPPGALAEVSLCLLENGNVERVVGGRGNYPDLPEGALLPGQIDVMWSEPEPLIVDGNGKFARCPDGSTLHVYDYKTGSDANVTSVDRNPQILSLGMMAQRWTGAREVVVGVIRPRPGSGEWDVTQPLRVAAMARVEAQIRRRLTVIDRERERYARGEPIALTEGSHCTYCPSQARCPAKTAMIKSIATGEVVRDDAAELTSEQAEWIAVRLASIKRFAEQATEALKAYVRLNGPIDLGDGVVWGPTTEDRAVINAHVAKPVLEEELGDQVTVAVQTTCTKSAIEEAIAELHSLQGIKRQKSAAMRRILAKLHEAGAIGQTRFEVFKPHRAKPAEVVALPANDGGKSDAA